MAMGRRIIFALGLLSCFILFISPSFSQSEKAVFHIQVFKSDSSVLNEGTGFFMDGNHGYSHALLFKNGAFAQAITTDSTVHRITKVNGYDPATGVVRFELDNMISVKLSKLKKSSNMSQEGASVKIIHSDAIQSTKSNAIKITNPEYIYKDLKPIIMHLRIN